MSWRDRAAPIIADVVRRVGREDPKMLRDELRTAYPFGAREGWPYKAWLAEVKEQIGGMRIRKPDPNQLELF